MIVTLGDVALKRLGGGSMRIGSCHGRSFELEKYIVFPMYHPAASIYRRALKEVIEEDFISWVFGCGRGSKLLLD